MPSRHSVSHLAARGSAHKKEALSCPPKPWAPGVRRAWRHGGATRVPAMHATASLAGRTWLARTLHGHPKRGSARSHALGAPHERPRQKQFKPPRLGQPPVLDG